MELIAVFYQFFRAPPHERNMFRISEEYPETRLPQASQPMGLRCSCPRRRAAPDFCLHPLPIPSSEIAVFRERDVCGSKGIVSRCTGAEGIPCGSVICMPCNADHAHLCPWCRNRETDTILAHRPEVTRGGSSWWNEGRYTDVNVPPPFPGVDAAGT